MIRNSGIVLCALILMTPLQGLIDDVARRFEIGISRCAKILNYSKSWEYN
jgi:hypothetical protein